MLKKIKSYLKKKLKPTVKDRIKLNGGYVDEGVYISNNVTIDYDYAFLLEFHEGAVIATGTILTNHDSSLPNAQGEGMLRIGKIVIEKNGYVGAGAIILPGVTIGAGSIVGAGSVVTHSIPPGEVWTGAPAKKYGTVTEIMNKRSVNSTKYFDIYYVGEVKKLSIDYPKFKEESIKKVRDFYAK